MIIFLKSILLLICNIIIPVGIVYLIRLLLVFPQEEKFFKGKKIPLTPGFVIKYRNILFNRINKEVNDYQTAVKTEDDLSTIISKWEHKAYSKGWKFFKKIDSIRFLPKLWRTNIRRFLSSFFFEIARQFLRKFVPFLAEKYKVKTYIYKAEMTVSKEAIIEFYDKYILKYSIYVFGGIALLIGFFNMILTWIIF